MRLEHTEEKSLQALAKQGSEEGTSTCNLELGGYSILAKTTKMKFGTPTHHSKGLLDCVHASIWGSTKTASLGGHRYFISFVDELFRHCCIYPMRQRFEVLDMLMK